MPTHLGWALLIMLIRKGNKEDLPSVLKLVLELAEYENGLDQVSNTLEKMQEDGFGDHPIYGLIVAEENGLIVGSSIYYYRYSTWKGKRLYLEDLIVNGIQERIRNRKAIV